MTVTELIQVLTKYSPHVKVLIWVPDNHESVGLELLPVELVEEDEEGLILLEGGKA